MMRVRYSMPYMSHPCVRGGCTTYINYLPVSLNEMHQERVGREKGHSLTLFTLGDSEIGAVALRTRGGGGGGGWRGWNREGVGRGLLLPTVHCWYYRTLYVCIAVQIMT